MAGNLRFRLAVRQYILRYIPEPAVAILIKNPETERKARELASLKGQTLTAVIDGALDRALEEAAPERRKPTLEEMIAATERFRALSGVKGPLPPVTKEEWDEINEIPGFDEDET